MQKLFFALGCLLALAPMVAAQNDRRYEFFGGYSHLRAEGIPDRDSLFRYFRLFRTLS